MKLYTFFRSSAAFRVRIALNLKGLQYESLPKAFARNEHRAPDYLALNPQGLIRRWLSMASCCRNRSRSSST
jgi:glutathione S-transferase